MPRPIPAAVTPPWLAPLTQSERTLIYYFLVIAGLALVAMLLRTVTSQREISSRYRPAIFAGTGVVVVAAISYAVLIVKFDVGYDRQGALFVPNGNAIWAWAPRFMDWSVTVPLLMIELIGVSALTGIAARRMRTLGVAGAFAMIFTGYLGGVVIDDGASLTALWIWGVISGLCMVGLYFVVLVTLVRSLPDLPPAARSPFRNASILLLAVWFVYPVVFGFQGFTSGGGWTAFEQIALSTADIVAKVGFGLLIHKVAKVRTAADVEAGLEVHPETIWADQHKQADAVAPAAVGSTSDERPLAGRALE